MGYPTTTFDLYTDEGYRGSLNIVGDATEQWATIVDAIVSNFADIRRIAVYKMNGEPLIEVKL